MTKLPLQFIENMKKQLPENEWEAFFAIYEKSPHKGVRLNPLKGTMSALTELLPFLGESIPWEENGFYTSAERVGNSPFHQAGLFYSQEPSAMSAAPLLEVEPGEKVLDLCSAPGGKGTQLACRMQGKGIILLNEPVFARAKVLSQNVERMGITNAVVTSELPEKLSAKFMGYFDKILVDAPCSGEGMFRKNAEEALGEWSEENVEMCAKRQAQILEEGTKMLKVGGRLCYSTCTFSEAEDEGQVCDYLAKHPEMRLLKQEKLYPHKVAGEGHFVALFEKSAKTTEWDTRLKECKLSCTQEGMKAYRAFEKDFFRDKFASRLLEVNGILYDLPEGMFDFKGIQVLRAGVRLGEVKNGRFEPSHSLALCVKAENCQRVIDLEVDDPRLEKYFKGETLEEDILGGWCVICVHGYPVGLGKAVNGIIKNHYPKGLRR